MTYDMNAVYRRCGHKIQQAFDITAEEFQAARKIGKKKKFGDILEWIKENRREPKLDAPTARVAAAVSPAPIAVPGMPVKGPVVLVPVPTEKLAEVLSVLGH